MNTTTTSCVLVEDTACREIFLNRLFQELHMYCDSRCVSEV